MNSRVKFPCQRPTIQLPAVVFVLLLLTTFSNNTLLAAFSANDFPLQIVTCTDDADIDKLILEFGLSPKFVFRSLNSFAATIDAATVLKLKADGRVIGVERDGPASYCDQTNQAGLV